jgi:hypothetical protein
VFSARQETDGDGDQDRLRHGPYYRRMRFLTPSVQGVRGGHGGGGCAPRPRRQRPMTQAAAASCRGCIPSGLRVAGTCRPGEPDLYHGPLAWEYVFGRWKVRATGSAAESA